MRRWKSRKVDEDEHIEALLRFLRENDISNWDDFSKSMIENHVEYLRDEVKTK